eukprot:UN34532
MCANGMDSPIPKNHKYVNKKGRIDLYNILGVSNVATHSEIKRSYRSLLKIHHPDKNNGKRPKEFLWMLYAFQILGDNKQRTLYDVYSYEGLAEEPPFAYQISSPRSDSTDSPDLTLILSVPYKPDRNFYVKSLMFDDSLSNNNNQTQYPNIRYNQNHKTIEYVQNDNSNQNYDRVIDSQERQDRQERQERQEQQHQQQLDQQQQQHDQQQHSMALVHQNYDQLIPYNNQYSRQINEGQIDDSRQRTVSNSRQASDSRRQTASDSRQRQTASDSRQRQTASDSRQRQTASDSRQRQTASDSRQRQTASDSRQRQTASDSRQRQTASDSRQRQLDYNNQNIDNYNGNNDSGRSRTPAEQQQYQHHINYCSQKQNYAPDCSNNEPNVNCVRRRKKRRKKKNKLCPDPIGRECDYVDNLNTVIRVNLCVTLKMLYSGCTKKVRIKESILVKNAIRDVESKIPIFATTVVNQVVKCARVECL